MYTWGNNCEKIPGLSEIRSVDCTFRPPTNTSVMGGLLHTMLNLMWHLSAPHKSPQPKQKGGNKHDY